MARPQISLVIAAVVLAGSALAPLSSGAAKGLHSGPRLRGGGVNVGLQIAYDGLFVNMNRNCPYCFKGYDYGHDCYQYVWTGFRSVWANVCLWGWR